jgi:CHAD domain-containing protein
LTASVPRTVRSLTLSAWPGFQTPTALAPWVETGPARTSTTDTRYADTADLRLTRMGVELVHEAVDGQTGTWRLVLGGTGIAAERELDAGPGSVPTELAAALRGAARGAHVEVIAHLRTQRRTVSLHDPAGRDLGELADIEVTVLHGRRVALRSRELEVSALDEAPPSFVPTVTAALQEAGAAPADATALLVRALGPRAMAPADPAIPPASDPPTLREVVQQAFTASVRKLLRHDPVVRLDAGDEGVHQMRVSTRRLRSDLRTFGPVLDGSDLAPVVDELRWLADALGAVRDLDVLAEGLAEAATDLPEPDQEGGTELVDRLLTTRDAARRSLLEVLDGDRYLALLHRIVELALDPPVVAEFADRPTRDVMVELVRAPWTKLRREVRSLPDEPPDEALHEVRIRAKRSRYAAEAIAAFVPPAEKLGARIAALQDVLGEHQDAIVAEAWLREAATKEDLPAAEAFAAGWLAAERRARAAELRDGWVPAWKRARKSAEWLER